MSPAKAELLHLEHSYRYVDNCTLLFVLFVGHGHLLLFETIRRRTSAILILTGNLFTARIRAI
jgi:hypothetical protein